MHLFKARKPSELTRVRMPPYRGFLLIPRVLPPSAETLTVSTQYASAGLSNHDFLNSFGQAAVLLNEQIDHGLSKQYVHLAL
jgi:hypothetical protein